MNLLNNIFGKNNKNSTVSSADLNGILSNIGDSLSARITNSGRKVLKVCKHQGNIKYSATQYSNGTIVETKTIKKK